MRVQSISIAAPALRSASRQAPPQTAGGRRDGVVFHGGSSRQRAKNIRTIATLAGTAAGAVALPMLTTGLAGAAARVLGGVQGAVALGAVGALAGGFLGGREEGFGGVAGAYGGALYGGVVGVIGGAVAGAFAGTAGLGTAFGVATGAAGGAFFGYTVGKGLTSS